MQDGGDDFRNDSALLPRHEAGAHRITRSAQRPGRTRRPGKTSGCRFDHESARERGASAKASIASRPIRSLRFTQWSSERPKRTSDAGETTLGISRKSYAGGSTTRTQTIKPSSPGYAARSYSGTELSRWARLLRFAHPVRAGALVPVRAEQPWCWDRGRALGRAARARA